MDFEPQKFFVGLIDFFSILLPGALLTFLLRGEAERSMWVAERLPQLSGAKGWVAFLVASYLLGHFAFLLGSWLDELYDWLRRRTLNFQIRELARRGKLIGWWVRLPVWLVFKRERNLAVERAGQIKRHSLAPLRAKNEINNFQWSKALLTVESPTSLAVVQRFEADSKFFRCFVIVLLVMLGLSWRWQNWTLAIAGLVLLPMAMWRYMEQRYKATNQAYWSVITLTAQQAKIKLEKRASAENGITHAGGVVFRKRWFRKARYLLVEASNDPTQWVLPKGKIDGNETTRETAVREVHEETGMWARIRAEMNPVSYSVKGSVITVQFFLMKYAGRGFKSEFDREHIWLPLNEAIKKASHLETRELLKSAEQRRAQR